MTTIPPLWIDWPFARIRRELSTNRGAVTAFVYQLEYNVAADTTRLQAEDWRAVARFDHDPESGAGHDVTEEGLHLDVYRNGEKHVVLRGFPPVSLDEAPRYCENYLLENADALLARFERWHDIGGPYRA